VQFRRGDSNEVRRKKKVSAVSRRIFRVHLAPAAPTLIVNGELAGATWELDPVRIIFENESAQKLTWIL
jgi:hypothetical protein